VFESVAPNGGVNQVGSTLPSFPNALAYDRGELFMMMQGSAYRWDGTTFDAIATTPTPYPALMAFDDTTMFLSSGDGNGGFVISSLPRTGGTFTTLYSTTGYLGGIAVDADHVWVVNRIVNVGGSFGTFSSALLRMRKDGSDLTTVFTSLTAQIVGVTVDDLCIYWTETGGGPTPSRVVAAPK
jgi:hypothetical protein